LLIAFAATSLEGCCRTPPPEVLVHVKACALPTPPVQPSLSSAHVCGTDVCLSVSQAKALEVYMIRARAWIAQAMACGTPTSAPTKITR
jgi:hypothetical protein